MLKFTFFLMLVLFGQTFAQTFPKSAVILEKAQVSANRIMVLWMVEPKAFPRENDEDDIYTCPDQTRGHYYSGVTKVSLIDTKTRKIINTLEIISDGLESGFNTRFTVFDSKRLL